MKCPKCGSELFKKQITEKQSFKGREVELSYNVFICPQCEGSFVDSASLEQAWKKVWDDYEKENHIPSPKTLREARMKLKLTAEELSKIIGRTKSLISKLENGSRRLSEPLLKVYENHIIPGGEDFAQLLDEAVLDGRITMEERNQFLERIGISNRTLLDREILSEHGDLPSVLNGYTVFDGEKFCACIAKIMTVQKSLDVMKLLKLMFYVDAESFVNTGKSIFGLRYKANLYGPTPYNYDIVLGYLKKKGVISDNQNKEHFLDYHENFKPAKVIAEEESLIIDSVLKTYGKLSSRKLSKLTHDEKCWEETEQGRIIRFNRNMIQSRIRVKVL